MLMGPTLTRRRFLKATGGTVVLLSLNTLELSRPRPGGAASARMSFEYRNWEDLYRRRWRWDRVTRCTHLRANCAAACSWDVYVKDGIAWREEQADVYGPTNAGLPDFGPRGWQEGACYGALRYSPARLPRPRRTRHPRRNSAGPSSPAQG